MAGDNNWEALLPPHWKASIKAWLLEDVPSFDIGGFVVGGESYRADTPFRALLLTVRSYDDLTVLRKGDCGPSLRQVAWRVLWSPLFQR